jgi:predicted aldo/keto reductase-like oxidoreductase
MSRTGKYNSGIIPAGSRLDASLRQDNGYIRGLAESLSSPIGKAKVEKIQKLEAIAKVLGCTTAQLAIAWAAKHPNVSTIILGATNPSQILGWYFFFVSFTYFSFSFYNRLTENLKALEVLPKVTDEIYTKISEIFDY